MVGRQVRMGPHQFNAVVAAWQPRGGEPEFPRPFWPALGAACACTLHTGDDAAITNIEPIQ